MRKMNESADVTNAARKSSTQVIMVRKIQKIVENDPGFDGTKVGCNVGYSVINFENLGDENKMMKP